MAKRRAKRVTDNDNDPIRKVSRVYRRNVPKNDYLKYWRVVRYWMKRKHSITTGDLDMLLFLQSEMYFDADRFHEYNNVIGWDTLRLQRLIEEGWVHIWRQKGPRMRALYEITPKTRVALAGMYRKLSREDLISEYTRANPLFRKNANYADKVYRNFIRKMNEEIKIMKMNEERETKERQQRLAQVLPSSPLLE
jgi:hypothetical protein